MATMSVTISTENGEYTTFTFKGGEFETVSPGWWLDEDGDEVGSGYTEALSALARELSEDVYASPADRACGARAMFVKTYN